MTVRNLSNRTHRLNLSSGRPTSWSNRPPIQGSYGGSRTFTQPKPNFGLKTLAELAAGAAAPLPPRDLSAFLPGVSVLHPDHGVGRIVSVEGAGNDRKAVVAFTVAGQRTFIISKSQLRLLR